VKETAKEKQQKLLETLEKVIEKAEPALKLGLWVAGTVTLHNVNIGGLVSWFGINNDRIPTGLPPPFHVRRRFPWEAEPEPTWEDQVTEWAIPAILSYIMIYKPVAIAQLIDAIVPF